MHPAVANAPGANGLAATLGGDAPFLVRIGLSNSTIDLEKAIAELDPARYAVLRVRNPLTTHLTSQGVKLQLATDPGDEPNGIGDDEVGHLLHALRVCGAGRPILVVVVEQAETLTPAALALLQLLPGLRGTDIPSVRVAFHGTSAFRTLLHDPRFRPIRDHDADIPPSPPSCRSPEGNRRGAVLGVAAVAILLTAVLVVSRSSSPIATVPAVPVTSDPVVDLAPQVSTSVEAPALPPPPAAVTPPSLAALPAPPLSAEQNLAPASQDQDQRPTSPAEPPPPSAPRPPVAVAEDFPAARARLFREFDAFVEARGLAGRLSRSDRETLFEEYLARRYAATTPTGPNLGGSDPGTEAPTATTAPEPTLPPVTRPEVVLFFRAGRPGAKALADEDAVLLRHQVSDVSLRPAIGGPANPTVKYFRSEDRSIALLIALALAPTTLDWQVMDLSGATGRSARPTIEVWLPSPP